MFSDYDLLISIKFLFYLFIFFLGIRTHCSSRCSASQTQELQQFPSLGFYPLLLPSRTLIGVCPFHQITEIAVNRAAGWTCRCHRRGAGSALVGVPGELQVMLVGMPRAGAGCLQDSRGGGQGSECPPGSGPGGRDEGPGYCAGLFLSLFRISFVLVRQSSCWRQ